ncbi:MAG: PAS domain-containing sensor histidine kinase [Planctomycetaceae bacterium]|nr:PAS domain-containing sensor histidine kinase [Planctomycetaceae bacterium]HAA71760.1 PAS domain-containing sensor histidine kinase [Planctomycetaceae bacterium]
MWSSRLFWKLFGSYGFLSVGTTILFVTVVSQWQQEQIVNQIKIRLHDAAVLVASDILDELVLERAESLQTQLLRLRQKLDTRITLVNLDGIVIADSDRVSVSDVLQMENHRERPELRAARLQGQGTAQRRSSTLEKPMLYFAIRVDKNQEPAGLVRTALPMTRVNQQISSITQVLWVAAILVNLAVAGLTFFLSAHVMEPIAALTKSAQAIASGNYTSALRVKRQDELGTLANSFNLMSEQFSAREQQLRESNQRLEAVLGGMAEGVIAVDERDRVILANAAAAELLGFTMADVESLSLLEVVRHHMLQQLVTDTRATESLQRAELEVHSGSENRRVLDVQSTPLPDTSPQRVILVLHDVTDLRRLESMRQEFVANVSHELKTPLSSIRAYAETLSAGAVNDPEHRGTFLHRIEEQADRLNNLIQDLLSLSRIESGRQTYDIATVNVADIVTTCIAENQGAANLKRIHLSCSDIQQDLRIQADEEGLAQIINNLIGNAIKYTSEGGEVTVVLRQQESTICMDVRDTGIGIDEEHLTRVFERFYRVDKARSRELGGTGLGLAIVKHLAQAFGGNVTVTSQPTKGSTFTVQLPVT